MYSFGQSPIGGPKAENLKIGKLWRTMEKKYNIMVNYSVFRRNTMHELNRV